MVGDWIDYAGTMYKINPSGPSTAANTFISVHTLVAHLGIKTAPGTNPAYIAVEEFLFGVGDRNGGPTVNAGSPLLPIAQETSTRVAMVAFTTNSTAGATLPGGNIFGIYVDPTNGDETEVPFPNGNPTNPISLLTMPTEAAYAGQPPITAAPPESWPMPPAPVSFIGNILSN